MEAPVIGTCMVPSHHKIYSILCTVCRPQPTFLSYYHDLEPLTRQRMREKRRVQSVWGSSGLPNFATAFHKILFQNVQLEVKYYLHFLTSHRVLDVSERGTLKTLERSLLGLLTKIKCKNPREVTLEEHLRPPFPDLQFVPRDPRAPPAINHSQPPQRLKHWPETSAFGDTETRRR